MYSSHTSEVIMSVISLWSKGWGIEASTPSIPMVYTSFYLNIYITMFVVYCKCLLL